MFDLKTSTSAFDDDQEILANMLGLHNANCVIQYHAPSVNAQPFDQWFKNHYKNMSKKQRGNMNILFDKLKEEHYV